MSDLVIRDINSIKIHTFTDLVNYFIRVNQFEGAIECASGIYYRGEQVTSNSQPMTFIEMFDPTGEDTFPYRRDTTDGSAVLFNDIVRTNNIETLTKLARKYFFHTLDNMKWI